MKEAVERIVGEEEAAKRSVEEARQKANRLILEAGSRAREMLDEAKGKASLESQKFIEKSEKDAADERKEKINQVIAQCENLKQDKKKQIKTVAEKVFNKIVDFGKF